MMKGMWWSWLYWMQMADPVSIVVWDCTNALIMETSTFENL